MSAQAGAPGRARPGRQRRAIALDDGRELTGLPLLASDMRVALILLDEARDQLVGRLLGVPRDKSRLVTLVVAAVVAQAIYDNATAVAHGYSRPSLPNTIAASAVLDEMVCSVTGSSFRDTPFIGPLIAVALIGGAVGPVAAGSARAVKASAHRARTAFDHRYGHLFRRVAAPLPRSGA